MAKLKNGDRAPDFKCLDEDSKIRTLSEFKGKWVVLYFYPKDMTPGCTQEAKDFRDSLALFSKKKAIILGVSKDSSKRHQSFIAKESLNFNLLADEDLKVCKLYGVYKKKSLYGREYMGIERTTFLINPKGKIEQIFSKVKVKNHISEILSTLGA